MLEDELEIVDIKWHNLTCDISDLIDYIDKLL